MDGIHFEIFKLKGFNLDNSQCSLASHQCACHSLLQGFKIPVCSQDESWPSDRKVSPFKKLKNPVLYISKDECQRKTQILSHNLAAQRKSSAEELKELLKWEAGLRNVALELRERVPLVEYEVANLERQLERVTRQASHDRALKDLYPEHMERERNSVEFNTDNNLEQRRRELETAKEQQLHVHLFSCPSTSHERVFPS